MSCRDRRDTLDQWVRRGDLVYLWVHTQTHRTLLMQTELLENLCCRVWNNFTMTTNYIGGHCGSLTSAVYCSMMNDEMITDRLDLSVFGLVYTVLCLIVLFLKGLPGDPGQAGPPGRRGEMVPLHYNISVFCVSVCVCGCVFIIAMRVQWYLQQQLNVTMRYTTVQTLGSIRFFKYFFK